MENKAQGQRIKMYRLQKGMSRAEVATAIGVGYSTFANYENGRRAVSVSMLKRIASVFGVAVADLIESEDGMATGKELKNILRDNGRKVTWLAEETGISPNTLYAIIKRDSENINYANLIKICDALQIPYDGLLEKANRNDTMTAERAQKMAKTHTSTAVKRRYNEKVYTQIALQIPKELAQKFTEKCAEECVSKRSVLIEAIERFIDEK